MAGVVDDFIIFSVSDDPSSDAVDRQLEDFLQKLANEGVLETLRKQGRQVAMRRRESQESLDQEGSITSSLTEPDDDVSVSTDSELFDRDQEPAAFTRRRWLPLGSKRVENHDKSSSFGFSDRFADSYVKTDEGPVVSDADLDVFLKGLEEEEASWSTKGFRKCVDRATDSLSYTLWSRNSANTPTEYRSRMVVEDCDPEAARDFFLDDAYRSEWDEARVTSSTLEDWNENGCQVSHWIRKFPLFLRDREYVVSKKIWSLKERTFHCISKQTTHPSRPKKQNPWRVESFLSEWRIVPVEGKNGAMSACEIVNFHQEESGLPKNISKMGVSRGMWQYVQKIEVNIRKYCAAGRNVKHLLPVFLIQADAKLQIKGQESDQKSLLTSENTSSARCSFDGNFSLNNSKDQDETNVVGCTSPLEISEEFLDCETVEEFSVAGNEEFKDCEDGGEKEDSGFEK